MTGWPLPRPVDVAEYEQGDDVQSHCVGGDGGGGEAGRPASECCRPSTCRPGESGDEGLPSAVEELIRQRAERQRV